MNNEKEAELRKFVKSLDPHILGVDKIESITISILPKGVWNFNYLVGINKKRFVFKLCPPGSSSVEGMIGNSGWIEFSALRLVEGLGIAPKPVLFADASQFSRYPVLIYQYVEGKELAAFSSNAVAEIARIYSKIHSLDIEEIDFLKKRSETPTKLLADIEKSFAHYENRADIDPTYLDRFGEFIDKAKKRTAEIKIKACPKSLIHADPVPSNFIVGQKIFLIDWQTPMIGDPVFDIWAFMSKAFSLWDLDAPPTEEQKRLFIKTYQSLREDPALEARLNLKEPLYLLQYGLHCSTRYYDYKSRKLSADLIEGRQASFEKYLRTTDVIIARLEEILG
ncbi:MAG: aminoglycoside phosphotransferase family protein [Dehalococcoidia bacterium]|nr:MAG: aminoglycoside phosphotransferase family protein [Dehalococcoidia bacterium]